jgi:LmbE family N-acetylglucosaminyl deacetylase
MQSFVFQKRNAMINNQTRDRGRLLAVLAHPDDETFGMGGTLALYAKRGFEVRLVCATRGEVGEAPSGLKGFATIGEMREAELRCAAGILGLAGIEFLDYRDSGMAGSPDNAHPQSLAAAPAAEVAEAVAKKIRAFRPQVVLTFDPIGGYRHPDHIAIQRATVAGFRMAGDPAHAFDATTPFAPQRLFFHTFPHTFLKWAVRLLRFFGKDPRRFGRNGDIDIAAIAEVEFPIHANISIRSVLHEKERASACHASQGGGVFAGPMRIAARIFGAHENFMQAWPEEPPRHMRRDLFEDVNLGE